MTLIPDPIGDMTCGPLAPGPSLPKKGGPFLAPYARNDIETELFRGMDELEIAAWKKDRSGMAAPPYVSIDIETTGLRWQWCQILEVGAVIDDWFSPLDRLPRFHCYVVHEQTIGEPKALAMNAKILNRIADRDKPENREYNFYTPSQVVHGLKRFIESQFYDKGSDTKVVAAGKNYARFDDRFLNMLPGFSEIKMLHRSIDPGMMYWNPRIDRVPPDTKTCLQRAGINTEVQHEAIDDALDVIRLIRTSVGIRI